MQFACWAKAAEFSDDEIQRRSGKNDCDYWHRDDVKKQVRVPSEVQSCRSQVWRTAVSDDVLGLENRCYERWLGTITKNHLQRLHVFLKTKTTENVLSFHK